MPEHSLCQHLFMAKQLLFQSNTSEGTIQTVVTDTHRDVERPFPADMEKGRLSLTQ